MSSYLHRTISGDKFNLFMKMNILFKFDQQHDLAGQKYRKSIVYQYQLQFNKTPISLILHLTYRYFLRDASANCLCSV